MTDLFKSGSEFAKTLSQFFSENSEVFSWFTFCVRFVCALLVLVILYRCTVSFFKEKATPELWGHLVTRDGKRFPIKHWENTIGRAPSSDIRLEFATVSRNHGALIRNGKGCWTIYDLSAKSGITLNGKEVNEKAQVMPGNELVIGGVSMKFVPLTAEGERRQAEMRKKPGHLIRPGLTLFLVTDFQILAFIQLLISAGKNFTMALPLCFAGLTALMWFYYAFYRAMRRTGFEADTLVFTLATLSLSVTASSAPESLLKQFAAVVAGLILYIVLCGFIRNLDRATMLRWPMAALAIGLLGFTQLFGQVVNGSKNWIYIAGISIQPSEFIKIAFVCAGAATLDRLFARRNLILFIVLMGICVGGLALMNDFGTALIFFVTFLVIAFLRSGSFASIILYCSGAVFGGLMAIWFRPHIAGRFSTWLHAWDAANINDSGFQQTRTMTYAASGGLFGVGAGKGDLKYVAASDTDLVFGMLCEEWGLIIALCAVAAIVVLAIFAIKSAANARSSYYAIAACAATSMLVFQTTLNTLGAVDILPLTGVTFPYVSNGGSSMVAAFGLLAFIKATDTRQNASIAIRLPRRFGGKSSDDYDDIWSDSGMNNAARSAKRGAAR